MTNPNSKADILYTFTKTLDVPSCFW